MPNMVILPQEIRSYVAAFDQYLQGRAYIAVVTQEDIARYFPSDWLAVIKEDRDLLRYLMDCLLEIATKGFAVNAICQFSLDCILILETMPWKLQPVTMGGLPLLIHNRRYLISQLLNDRIMMSGLLATETPREELLGLDDPLNRDALIQANVAQGWSIPRRLFCVWIGPRPVPFTAHVWKEFCETHGYEFTLFDEQSAIQFLGPQADLFFRYIEILGYHGASNILRYCVLEEIGGFYVDLDYVPSSSDYDVLSYFSSTGLTVFPESGFRDLVNGSYFFGNSLIFCPPHHPVMQRVRRTVRTSIDKIGYLPSWWASGPCLFTRALFGNFQTSSFPFASDHVDASSPLDLRLKLTERAHEINLPLVFCRPWND